MPVYEYVCIYIYIYIYVCVCVYVQGSSSWDYGCMYFSLSVGAFVQEGVDSCSQRNKYVSMYIHTPAL